MHLAGHGDRFPRTAGVPHPSPTTVPGLSPIRIRLCGCMFRKLGMDTGSTTHPPPTEETHGLAGTQGVGVDRNTPCKCPPISIDSTRPART